MRIHFFAARVLIIIPLCLSATHAAIPKTVTFTDFFGPTVSLDNPLNFSELPGKPGYFVVLEQYSGQVALLHKQNGAWMESILDTVMFGGGVTSSNEMGLLGIAFHPDFPNNHKYYLNYNPTTSLTYVVERQTDSTLLKRNPAIASKILLNIDQPYTNHNGGNLAFNPKDGFLYIGMGDGGSGGDPMGNGQNKKALLAKMLRIDVDHPANGKPYGIPADNPFVSDTALAPEVFAYGIRNPWRWSFDTTGVLWLGHVGQDLWESATLVPKGSNLGWNVVEGNHCYNPATGCSMTGFQLPFFTYPHSGSGDTIGVCAIGGYVYRGNAASPFFGLYFLGDNGSGRIWAIRTDGKTRQEYALEGTVSNLTSFGTDSQHNLYAVSRGGTVYLLGGADMQSTPIWQPRRKSHRVGMSETGNADLFSLQGIRLDRQSAGLGLYVTRQRDGSPSLVPVLK